MSGEARHRHLETGRCYYMVSFLDDQSASPIVDTFIFIGLNLQDVDMRSEKGSIWYFKNSDSYSTSGVRFEDIDFADCIRVGEDTIDLVLDLDDLIRELNRIAEP